MSSNQRVSSKAQDSGSQGSGLYKLPRHGINPILRLAKVDTAISDENQALCFHFSESAEAVNHTLHQASFILAGRAGRPVAEWLALVRGQP